MTPEEFRAAYVEALRPLVEFVAANLPKIEAALTAVVDDMTAKAERYANEGEK